MRILNRNVQHIVRWADVHKIPAISAHFIQRLEAEHQRKDQLQVGVNSGMQISVKQ
jgi:hypothetical protein